MWDLPGPGIKPVSLALAVRFLSIGPSWKSWIMSLSTFKRKYKPFGGGYIYLLGWGIHLVWSESDKNVLVAQSYPTLGNPMDCGPPGSSAHGILQARILEWVAMPSSRGFSQPMDWAHVSYVCCIGRQLLYHGCHPGSPMTDGPYSSGSELELWEIQEFKIPTGSSGSLWRYFVKAGKIG